MSTTSLFAEHVVGGLLTLTWLSIIGMSVFGCPADLPSSDNLPLEFALLLAVAYPLGVVFDRLWDVILAIMGLQARLSRDVELTDNDRLRGKVFCSDTSAATEFVNYNRSRMRIARASVFNFALITASASLYIAVRGEGLWTKEFLVVALGGVLITAVSILAFAKLSKTYERCLRIAAGDGL